MTKKLNLLHFKIKERRALIVRNDLIDEYNYEYHLRNGSRFNSAPMRPTPSISTWQSEEIEMLDKVLETGRRYDSDFRHRGHVPNYFFVTD